MNNQEGSAYVFVLVGALMMTMLAVVALTVTISSRRLTAMNDDFSSLEHLAISGNERALFFLREAFEVNMLDPNALPPLLVLQQAALQFSPTQWEMEVVISVDDEVLRYDMYRFLTILTPFSDRIRVQTQVYRVADIPVPATVRAYIILDDTGVAMVHSMRITS